MAKPLLRKHLSAPGLLKSIRQVFSQIEATDSCHARNDISLADCLMSGMAIFGLKYPSLLQFDQDKQTIQANLRSLYGIKKAPCDTTLRERLDNVDPALLRQAFTRIFANLQRGKGLEGMEFMDEHYLLSVDGTGYFSSKQVHCKQCCEKHHRNGQITYYPR